MGCFKEYQSTTGFFGYGGGVQAGHRKFQQEVVSTSERLPVPVGVICENGRAVLIVEGYRPSDVFDQFHG